MPGRQPMTAEGGDDRGLGQGPATGPGIDKQAGQAAARVEASTPSLTPRVLGTSRPLWTRTERSQETFRVSSSFVRRKLVRLPVAALSERNPIAPEAPSATRPTRSLGHARARSSRPRRSGPPSRAGPPARSRGRRPHHRPGRRPAWSPGRCNPWCRWPASLAWSSTRVTTSLPKPAMLPTTLACERGWERRPVGLIHRRLISHPRSTPIPSAIPRARVGSLTMYFRTIPAPPVTCSRAVAARSRARSLKPTPSDPACRLLDPIDLVALRRGPTRFECLRLARSEPGPARRPTRHALGRSRRMGLRPAAGLGLTRRPEQHGAPVLRGRPRPDRVLGHLPGEPLFGELEGISPARP